jgi:hypothetical protein
VFTTTKKTLPLVKAVTDFQADVEAVVVETWAVALADAYNYQNEEGCFAFSDGAVDKIDAIAEAGMVPTSLFVNSALHVLTCCCFECLLTFLHLWSVQYRLKMASAFISPYTETCSCRIMFCKNMIS